MKSFNDNDKELDVPGKKVEDMLYAQFKTNGGIIPQFVDLENSKKERISRIEIEKKKINIVFLYDTKDCDICVQNELDMLQKARNENHTISVKGILRSSNYKYIDIYKRINKIQFELLLDRSGDSLKNSLSMRHR